MATYKYRQGDRPIDGYTIQYALGRGGFGEVYFAVSDAGREVALKFVQNYEDIELRGIRHCMNLKSSNLVTIFDVRFAADGAPWVIMEYVAGPSLREIIDESPAGLGTQRTAFLFRELAKGIAYLHNAGVVHRDLKPHNVFFEDGTVKIGDYSLSKAISTSHRSGHTMTVGSVHYMAPEISLGKYDKTVDIYALGVILYEMLCGVPPYVGESLGEVLMKHLSSEPDVSALPEPFASTIRKAMRRDPAERFQSAYEMAESLLCQSSIRDQVQSFNPQTLSMVGDRKRRLESGQQARASQPLAETFTSPAMLRDTKQVAPAVFEDAPPEPTNLLQRLGLWYSRSQITDRNPDPLNPVARIAIAVCSTAPLALYGFVFSSINRISYAELAFLTLIQLSVSVVICIGMAGLLQLDFGNWIWCGFTMRRRDLESFNRRAILGLVSRVVLVSLAFAILWYTATNSPGASERTFLGVVTGILVSLMALDWRCFAAPHRHHRILLRPTIGVGFIALVASVAVLGESRCEIISACLAMSLAIGLQLAAPLQRPKRAIPRATSSLPNAVREIGQVSKIQANDIPETVV